MCHGHAQGCGKTTWSGWVTYQRGEADRACVKDGRHSQAEIDVRPTVGLVLGLFGR